MKIGVDWIIDLDTYACTCVTPLHPSRVQRYEKYFKYASILEENLNFSSFCRGKGSFACKKKAETYVSA